MRQQVRKYPMGFGSAVGCFALGDPGVISSNRLLLQRRSSSDSAKVGYREKQLVLSSGAHGRKQIDQPTQSEIDWGWPDCFSSLCVILATYGKVQWKIREADRFYIVKPWFLHASLALIKMALGQGIILLRHCNWKVIALKLAGYGECFMVYIGHSRLAFQLFGWIACFASENDSWIPFTPPLSALTLVWRSNYDTNWLQMKHYAFSPSLFHWRQSQ